VDVWRPFTDFVVSNLWRVKRDLVFLAWGPVAKEVVRYKGGPDDDSTQPAAAA
jgi:uracil DNA glycosylase